MSVLHESIFKCHQGFTLFICPLKLKKDLPGILCSVLSSIDFTIQMFVVGCIQLAKWGWIINNITLLSVWVAVPMTPMNCTPRCTVTRCTAQVYSASSVLTVWGILSWALRDDKAEADIQRRWIAHTTMYNNAMYCAGAQCMQCTHRQCGKPPRHWCWCSLPSRGSWLPACGCPPRRASRRQSATAIPALSQTHPETHSRLYQSLVPILPLLCPLWYTVISTIKS